MALRTLSLCAGYGGIELGIRAARPDLRVVGAVERQAYAAAVLGSRMADGGLDACPVWDDLETFDCRPYRGRVDLVTAGFPCQPASLAGRRSGTADKRWLWPLVLRTAVDVGASLLLVENVPGLLSVNGGEAFGDILSDLAALGWAAEWDCIPAGSVGAPHLRDRVFLLAADPNRIVVRLEPERDQRQGRGERAAERGYAEPAKSRRRRKAANPDGDRPPRERDGGQLDQAVRSAQRDDADGRGGAPRAAFQWRDAPEPAIRGVDDGAAGGVGGRSDSYAEELHLLGNGVVPQAAEQAWRVLWERLIGDTPT